MFCIFISSAKSHLNVLPHFKCCVVPNGKHSVSAPPFCSLALHKNVLIFPLFRLILSSSHWEGKPHIGKPSKFGSGSIPWDSLVTIYLSPSGGEIYISQV